MNYTTDGNGGLIDKDAQPVVQDVTPPVETTTEEAKPEEATPEVVAAPAESVTTEPAAEESKPETAAVSPEAGTEAGE